MKKFKNFVYVVALKGMQACFGLILAMCGTGLVVDAVMSKPELPKVTIEKVEENKS